MTRGSGQTGVRLTAREKTRRFLAIGLCAVLALAASIAAVQVRIERLGSRSVVPASDAPKGVDCILVPGALVYGTTPSTMLADRLQVALDLYRAGISDRILVSGDHGRSEYDEVAAMKRWLTDRGVPSSAVFMDHAGFDTYDSLYRARDVFRVRSAVVATQRFHLVRALYIGDRLGLDLAGVDAAVRPYGKDDWYRIREFFARIKAFLETEILQVSPTYLGDPIPISGDGNQTGG